MTSNAERIKRYKQRMSEFGFKRLTVWIHPDLADLLEKERTRSECNGRVLERLILGKAGKRPPTIYKKT